MIARESKKEPMNQRPDIKPRSRKSHWKQDPDAVKADILRIATEEFSTNGLSGARIDEIARRTEASKRMIYYYFGDKEGLYRHVLEAAYARIRNEETRLDLDTLDPVTALRRLVEFTFDSHRNTPEFIRLVMIENIHNPEYLKGSDRIPSLNSTAISKLTTLCERGKAAGLFRDNGCDGLVGIGGGSPLDLAKGVALMGTHPGTMSDYAGVANVPRIGAQAAPVITIPTTSGTSMNGRPRDNTTVI